jgi:hypothetical protein
MKKKIVTIVIALMLSSIPAMAQIFISDEDLQNSRVGTTNLGMDLPGTYNSGEDWYAPVGSGAVLLAGLAGAYLLGKRHKKEK